MSAGLALAVLTPSAAQAPDELDVMSSGGFTAAYQELAGAFTAATGIELRTVYGASMGGATRARIDRLPKRSTQASTTRPSSSMAGTDA